MWANIILIVYLQAMHAKKYFLSLGSNLENRALFLQKALLKLEKNVGKIQKVSNVYQTPALNFKGFDFYNICIEISSSKNPLQVLKHCLDIEKKLGRLPKKSTSYENRPIDIDVIYCEKITIQNKYLTLPHPRALKRKFILVPLCEITGGLPFAGTEKTVSFWLKNCPDKSPIKNMGKLENLITT